MIQYARKIHTQTPRMGAADGKDALRSDDMSRWNQGNQSMWLHRAVGMVAAVVLLGSAAAGQTRPKEIKQPWKAPAAAAKVPNPVKPTPAGLKAAAALYQQNCVICHGEKGASNGPAASSLPQKPANFTDKKMMDQATDGELFWKMTNGRAPMPSWQDRLTKMQRWELVNYLRQLTKEGRYRYLGKTN
jgi:mono/diheme cytochrome c family protein